MAQIQKGEMFAGASYPHIFTFPGASSVTSAETYVYRNGVDVSTSATGKTPTTILSDSTSINSATVTGKILTIPTTGYFGSILEYVVECVVDGKTVRPRIWIYVPQPPKS